MPDAAGIDRIAAAMNDLRPDWKVSSLRTFLATHHGARPYRDLAIAAVAIATDPKTTTPQLLNQHGAWWAAAQVAAGSTPAIHFDRCTEPGHQSFPAGNCSACRAEDLESETPRAERVDPGRDVVYEIGARLARAELARARGEQP